MQDNARVKRSIKIMFFVVVGMFGFAYAMVPMYNVLCKAIGINGKIGGQVNVTSDVEVDESREIRIEFLSTNNAELPWDFKPLQKVVTLNPGKLTQVGYYAKNNTDHPMTIQAIPSVTPSQAAKYLKKTECFCFTRQTLQGGEEMDMGILFHVDSKIPKKFSTITISYTIFDVEHLPDKKNKNAGRIS